MSQEPRPTAKKRYRAGAGISTARATQAASPDTDTEQTSLEDNRASSGRVVTDALTDRQVNPQVRTMLADLYGTDAKGHPDTAAAAAAHGLSRRTIQRWLQKGAPKRSQAMTQVKDAWNNSAAGRRRRTSPQRRNQLSQGGIVHIYAAVTISTPDPRNGVVRGFNVPYSKAEGEALYRAMLNGDAEAHAAMDAIARGGFGGDVDFDFRSVQWK